MTYSRGSQPFGTHVPPNQDCPPLHTPKSELYFFGVPQYQKFYPNKLVLSGFFNLVYPLRFSHVPLGVRVPQVENRCPTGFDDH
jgi:hypothetical protein